MFGGREFFRKENWRDRKIALATSCPLSLSLSHRSLVLADPLLIAASVPYDGMMGPQHKLLPLESVQCARVGHVVQEDVVLGPDNKPRPIHTRLVDRLAHTSSVII